MTLVSTLVSAGFSLRAMFTSGGSGSLTQYAASRSVALLLGVLYALMIRSRGSVIVLAAVMSIVQALDGVIGVMAHDPAKTYGPFLFAVLNIVVLIRLQSEPELTQ